MKASRIHGRGGHDHLVYEEAPQPQPTAGDVLVRVAASAIIAKELTWDLTYQTPTGDARALPIPGRDMTGVVAALGPGVTEFAVGDAVYALIGFGRDGANAEYALALPSELAAQPPLLDAVRAAAVPLSALTAWQALFTHAGVVAGQTVLIHGAAGGVGTYAVQFARWVGARVIATAGGRHFNFLRELVADAVIDYTTQHFEENVQELDVVFDMVGGATLARSWQVVKDGGTIAHAAAAQGHTRGKIVLRVGE